MSYSVDIVRLYSAVLLNDVHRNSLSDDEMKSAIASMQQVYMPESGRLLCAARSLADYNSMAFRCAYLHKYASFHTAMVHDIMKCILLKNDTVFRLFQKWCTSQQKFKICSLGGGPGSDTVGVLLAMFKLFGLFPCSTKVIDLMSEWEDTLASVINGLSSGMCGAVGEGFTRQFFNWDFLTADLLEEVDDDVKSAIRYADMVMMVKFVSAAACDRTEWMLKKIFTMMKLGAVVLFIDNSSGGYREVVSKAATDCNLTSVCGPIKYQVYTNEHFKITHWGHTSCYTSTVTVHMMQKLRPSPPVIQIPSKKIVNSTPKPNISLSSTNNNNEPAACSGLEAENIALQAKLKEIQDKSLKERNEFIAKIVELEKTVSSNRNEMKILTETIVTLEKYKADVAVYEVQIVSAKEEIVNLNKELEKAKLLQVQGKFCCCESPNLHKERDLKTTGQHQRVLRSNQSKVDDSKTSSNKIVYLKTRTTQRKKTSSNKIASLKTRTTRRKLQEMENKPVKKANMRKKKVKTAQSGSRGISSLRVTQSCKKLFNFGVGPKKTKPNLAQSVSNMPSSRVLRGRKKLFISDVKPNTKAAKPKLTQSMGSASSPRETRSHKKLLMLMSVLNVRPK